MNHVESESESVPPPEGLPAGIAERASVSVRTLILSVMGTAAVVAFISVGATIEIAGGSDSPTKTAASSTTATYETPVGGTNATVTTTAEPEIASIGDPVVNGSAQLTVTEVTYPATVERYRSSESGYVAVEPKASAKFVLVETTLENVGSVGFNTENGVQAAVMDVDQRFFKTVEKKYDVRLNFERGISGEHPDELQPGFSTTMYYVFEVPESAEIVAFAFADNAEASPTYSYVQVTS